MPTLKVLIVAPYTVLRRSTWLKEIDTLPIGTHLEKFLQVKYESWWSICAQLMVAALCIIVIHLVQLIITYICNKTAWLEKKQKKTKLPNAAFWGLDCPLQEAGFPLNKMVLILKESKRRTSHDSQKQRYILRTCTWQRPGGTIKDLWTERRRFFKNIVQAYVRFSL